MNHRIGDKIKVKAKRLKGQRGTITQARGDEIQISLGDNKFEWVPTIEVTNYSLAARKAWVTHPHRTVGRPVGSTKADRVSVTLRIDKDIWSSFRELEKKGTITNRSTTINLILSKFINKQLAS